MSDIGTLSIFLVLPDAGRSTPRFNLECAL